MHYRVACLKVAHTSVWQALARVFLFRIWHVHRSYGHFSHPGWACASNGPLPRPEPVPSAADAPLVRDTRIRSGPISFCRAMSCCTVIPMARHNRHCYRRDGDIAKPRSSFSGRARLRQRRGGGATVRTADRPESRAACRRRRSRTSPWPCRCRWTSRGHWRRWASRPVPRREQQRGDRSSPKQPPNLFQRGVEHSKGGGRAQSRGGKPTMSP